MAAPVESTEGQGADNLTDQEATQYDRQIRLWGLEAQYRIRKTRILMHGARGLAIEASHAESFAFKCTAKNLVLGGVCELHLADPEVTVEDDLGAQFFLTLDDLGKNRASASVERLQQLNPMVNVKASATSLEQLDAAFLGQFDVVCLTDASLAQAVRIDDICRQLNIRFFCGRVYGFYGYFFSNQHTHDYILKLPQSDGTEAAKQVKKQKCFPTLRSALEHSLQGVKKRRCPRMYPALLTLEAAIASGKAPESILPKIMTEHHVAPEVVTPNFVNAMYQGWRTEMVSTSAIVGGMLGSEIIKAISNVDEPIYNTFFWDADESSGSVELLGQTASDTKQSSDPVTPAEAAVPVADVIEL
ncbi:uncharacterized protein MONBRDRAFT_29549 [Monosiga brevicollis MX1]|uniref:THIF-type NAD/FAD binding fold domain-containing protein n=1 Tax=Monosiga brevicollis TaxID=81824 RepID=A9VBE9_MONBE|nr:uncharacterized protein MONBRDRAFT_29549 [Monosiga brevicollis MX1]EDQ85175.1 predicted protein [Monosiga brevicollis MX1]|eukprot:XP_001750000.1 hypothetical protein [Monosiga brevicollis MX1]